MTSCADKLPSQARSLLWRELWQRKALRHLQEHLQLKQWKMPTAWWRTSEIHLSNMTGMSLVGAALRKQLLCSLRRRRRHCRCRCCWQHRLRCCHLNPQRCSSHRPTPEEPSARQLQSNAEHRTAASLTEMHLWVNLRRRLKRSSKPTTPAQRGSVQLQRIEWRAFLVVTVASSSERPRRPPTRGFRAQPTTVMLPTTTLPKRRRRCCPCRLAVKRRARMQLVLRHCDGVSTQRRRRH